MARVRARSSSIARTTSRSTGAPMPAACERTSACCSSSRRALGGCARWPASRTRSRRRRRAARRQTSLGDHGGARGHRLLRRSPSVTGASWRATATTSRRPGRQYVSRFEAVGPELPHFRPISQHPRAGAWAHLDRLSRESCSRRHQRKHVAAKPAAHDPSPDRPGPLAFPLRPPRRRELRSHTGREDSHGSSSSKLAQPARSRRPQAPRSSDLDALVCRLGHGRRACRSGVRERSRHLERGVAQALDPELLAGERRTPVGAGCTRTPR